jgi:lipopolysaccharide export system permease protein
MREKLYEVRGDLAAKLVRPGQFRSPADGLTIYTKEIDRNGRMVDLLIEDSREDDRAVTYMAKTGVFTEIRGEPALLMTEGSIQSLEPNHSMSYLRFDSYPFVLSTVIDAPTSLFYKLSDRYLHELLFPNPNDLWDWRHRADLLAEGHYRLSGPLYNLAFVLIALASLLGGEFSRIGYARRIAIGAVAALVVRMLGFSVQAACADNAMLNPLQYAIPLGTAWVAAAMLFGRAIKPPRRGAVEVRAEAAA